MKCKPERGDILIVSRGATVGRSCLVTTDIPFCLLGSVILVKSHSAINSKYIAFTLKYQVVYKQLIGLCGSTAQQAIYIRDIRNVIIPIPSIEEQRCIVSELEKHLSILEKLAETTTINLELSKRLRQSILKRAFEGKLVPQNPNDEPADKLLKHIKEEKEKGQRNTRRITALEKHR